MKITAVNLLASPMHLVFLCLNMQVAGEHGAILAQQGNYRSATATYERILRLAQQHQQQQRQSEAQHGDDAADEDEDNEEDLRSSSSSKRDQVKAVCLDHWFGYAASSWAMVDARAALDIAPNWSFDNNRLSAAAAAPFEGGERGGAAAVGPLSCGGDVGSYTHVMTYQEKVRMLASSFGFEVFKLCLPLLCIVEYYVLHVSPCGLCKMECKGISCSSSRRSIGDHCSPLLRTGASVVKF